MINKKRDRGAVALYRVALCSSAGTFAVIRLLAAYGARRGGKRRLAKLLVIKKIS
jgi:hypothetical protein